ncbi:hypothetical protein UFOVP1562_16 [uncultured Caudovirales phage]|uniref:Coil containing protein n=1 Tax=uncultured Caudovirales phage TaxID=2100421 RepID=A0A6J7XFF6_9CAUD|nr:hypothetical protein UFOVP1562_16 [uncultured Caudovirales phage]
MAELKELVDITPNLTAGARYKKSIAEPMKLLHERRIEEAEFGATQKEDVLRREAERGKKKAEASRAEVQEIKTSPEFTGLRKLEEETMGKAFIPTQDTAVDIASLYSLVNVIGMSIGAGGKQNAMQAMHAMNGMLEGYQKGRGDLYKKEKDIFDTSMKTLKTKTDILQRRLKEIADLASKNAAAADQEADVLFAEQGADFLKKYKEKFGLPATVKLWEDVVKAQEKASMLTLREEETAAKDAAAERRHRENMAQRERMARLQREATAAKATATKGEKPPAKEIIIRNELRNTLIPKLESAIPIIDRLNQENKWNKLTSLLAIDPRAAEAQFKNDEEALSLIRTLAYFRSKEFETAGKALTRKEDQILAPIVRSDLRVYEATRGALLDGLKTMQQEQIGLEAMYPYIKTYNQTMRGEVDGGGAAPDIDAEREAAYQAIQAGADINAVKARFKQKTGQGLGADEE